ncbi:hypothetical protein FRX31_025292 [Thalictrum thalictroides]|uniref:Cytochrome p450 n=1 Tax=Thalictrum thalictroides TaxID=46969 RepID=A0A7J6VLV6_THATH|nr:hypothetical protein FRX31_025292 [Thalictrum thalictroides]
MKIRMSLLPVGSRIMVNTYAIGRDKTARDNTDLFNPSRYCKENAADFHANHAMGNNFEFIPLGSGRRSWSVCNSECDRVSSITFGLIAFLGSCLTI